MELHVISRTPLCIFNVRKLWQTEEAVAVPPTTLHSRQMCSIENKYKKVKVWDLVKAMQLDGRNGLMGCPQKSQLYS